MAAKLANLQPGDNQHTVGGAIAVADSLVGILDRQAPWNYSSGVILDEPIIV